MEKRCAGEAYLECVRVRGSNTLSDFEGFVVNRVKNQSCPSNFTEVMQPPFQGRTHPNNLNLRKTAQN